jgi:hypothetical protein
VPEARLELAADGLKVRRSIQSYRTPDTKKPAVEQACVPEARLELAADGRKSPTLDPELPDTRYKKAHC